MSIPQPHTSYPQTPLEPPNEYTVGEEIAHSVTHGIGIGLAVAALSLLVTLAALYGDAWRVVSFSIYGATLVFMYLASTLYHGVPWPRLKRLLRVFDYASIYALIAGTYTPFCLVTLRGPWGWSIFGVIWGLAAVGIALTPRLLLSKTPRPRWVMLIPAGIYIGMGWLIMIAMHALWVALPGMGIMWLVVGGLSYTLGVAVFVRDQWPYNHAVWHLFVLGGSICHFFGLFFYVLPMAAE